MLPPTARRSLVGWCMPPSTSSVFRRHVVPSLCTTGSIQRATRNGQHATDNTLHDGHRFSLRADTTFYRYVTTDLTATYPSWSDIPCVGEDAKYYRNSLSSCSSTFKVSTRAVQCSAARIVCVASRWKVVASFVAQRRRLLKLYLPATTLRVSAQPHLLG